MPTSQLPKDSATEFLMPRDAAAALGVTTTTLAAWAAIGAVEAIRLPSGHRRYVASSVRAMAERLRAGGAA